MKIFLLNFTTCLILFAVFNFTRVYSSKLSEGITDELAISPHELTQGISIFSFGVVAGSTDVKGQAKNNFVLPWKR